MATKNANEFNLLKKNRLPFNGSSVQPIIKHLHLAAAFLLWRNDKSSKIKATLVAWPRCSSSFSNVAWEWDENKKNKTKQRRRRRRRKLRWHNAQQVMRQMIYNKSFHCLIYGKTNVSLWRCIGPKLRQLFYDRKLCERKKERLWYRWNCLSYHIVYLASRVTNYSISSRKTR